jgi:hypothetical protein
LPLLGIVLWPAFVSARLVICWLGLLRRRSRARSLGGTRSRLDWLARWRLRCSGRLVERKLRPEGILFSRRFQDGCRPLAYGVVEDVEVE